MTNTISNYLHNFVDRASVAVIHRVYPQTRANSAQEQRYLLLFKKGVSYIALGTAALSAISSLWIGARGLQKEGGEERQILLLAGMGLSLVAATCTGGAYLLLDPPPNQADPV